MGHARSEAWAKQRKTIPPGCARHSNTLPSHGLGTRADRRDAPREPVAPANGNGGVTDLSGSACEAEQRSEGCNPNQ